MVLMKRQQSGMTLLEVLIAVSLMVIISAISYTGLNGLIETKSHTDSVAKNIRKEVMVSQFLNKDFHSLINRKVKDEFGQQSPSVIGTYSSVVFSRNGNSNPFAQKRSQLQRVQWFLRDGTLYRSSRNMLDAASSNQWQQHALMENVREFSINYQNSVGITSSKWPINNSELPLKSVQIHLELENDTNFNFMFGINP